MDPLPPPGAPTPRQWLGPLIFVVFCALPLMAMLVVASATADSTANLHPFIALPVFLPLLAVWIAGSAAAWCWGARRLQLVSIAMIVLAATLMVVPSTRDFRTSISASAFDAAARECRETTSAHFVGVVWVISVRRDDAGCLFTTGGMIDAVGVAHFDSRPSDGFRFTYRHATGDLYWFHEE